MKRQNELDILNATRLTEAEAAAAIAKGEAEGQALMLDIADATDEALYTDIFEEAEMGANSTLAHDYGIGELVDVMNGYW